MKFMYMKGDGTQTHTDRFMERAASMIPMEEMYEAYYSLYEDANSGKYIWVAYNGRLSEASVEARTARLMGTSRDALVNITTKLVKESEAIL